MIAEVIVDVLSSNVDKVFDYNIPSSLDVVVGDRVDVPFGPRKVDGFIINIKDTSNYDLSKLKDIISKKDTQPLLSQNMVRLCFFMKQKFYLRLADTIRLFLPPVIRSGKVKEKIVQYVYLNTDDFSGIKKGAKMFKIFKKAA